MIVLWPLTALAVFVLVVSARGVASLSGGCADSRVYLGEIRRALRAHENPDLLALARDASWAGRALARALEAHDEGGRARLAAHEVSIEARSRATRALSWLRAGATLGSVLGLLGALLAYLAPSPEVFPLEALERGGIERDAMARAALCITAGLGVHAYAIQAYSALRRDAARVLGDLAAVEEALLALEEDHP